MSCRAPVIHLLGFLDGGGGFAFRENISIHTSVGALLRAASIMRDFAS